MANSVADQLHAMVPLLKAGRVEEALDECPSELGMDYAGSLIRQHLLPVVLAVNYFAFPKLTKLGYRAHTAMHDREDVARAWLGTRGGDKYVCWLACDPNSADRIGGRMLWLIWKGDAEEIMAVLRDAGLETEWKGGSADRIKVTLPEAMAALGGAERADA
jgi:hypothetical protein